MAVTPINSEDRLVQATLAEHLEQVRAGTASMPGTRRLRAGWHPRPCRHQRGGADPRPAGGAGTAQS